MLLESYQKHKFIQMVFMQHMPSYFPLCPLLWGKASRDLPLVAHPPHTEGEVAESSIDFTVKPILYLCQYM